MTIVGKSPIHRIRIVASFALLGAVVAGMMETVPLVAALAAMVDFHVVGALVGGVVGTAMQAGER